MAAPTRTPRSSWIDAGLRALAARGPDAVRIEPLARELGVTKGGFYWHFANRGALLEEMLDAWETRSVDEVIERIEREGGDARAKLQRLSALAGRSDETLGIDPLQIDLAIRDWARREQGIADRLRRVDDRRMDYMRSLFGDLFPDEADVEARCLLAFSLWIGSHFVAAGHGARDRGDVVRLALGTLAATRPGLRPVGRVESPLTDLASAPKQGDEGAPDACLVFEPSARAALDGISAGDEVIVVTWLDRARRDVLRVHPRGDPARPQAGVFSTRSPHRPNPVGLHQVEVISIDGRRVGVRNLEAVDGTPVIDLKPVLSTDVAER